MKNKVLLITGSSIGIGRATALLCAKEGAKVVITYYRHKEEALENEQEGRKLGAADVLVLQLNLMDDESIKQTVKKVIEKFGKIDVLINNAGAIVWGPLKDLSFREIEIQTRTNLEGLIKITRECLPHIKERIINIASGVGYEGHVELASYSATKFGVRGFTQSLSKELSDIEVLTVNPKATKTRMTNFRGDPPEKVAEIIVKAASGESGKKSGEDIDVWDYLK